jgi:DNA-binding beta-propeller fold protein YncE
MNRKLSLLLALPLAASGLVSCGSDGTDGRPGQDGADGADGTSCQVETLENGARIACSDGSTATVQSGDSCMVVALQEPGAAEIRCEDGSMARVGTPEDACVWTTVEDGVVADCPDGSRYVFRDTPETPPAAVRLVAGVASVGASDGVGSQVRMDGALTGDIDRSGDFLYFVDSFNGTVRRFGVASRRVLTLAGQPGVEGISDGPGPDAAFENPRGIAVDDDRGLLYINDGFNCTLRTVTLDGPLVRTIGGAPGECGHTDGPLSEARFGLIIGSAMGPDGRFLYLSDRGSQTIRRVDLEAGIVETIAGQVDVRGSDDGIGTAATFNGPGGIVFDDEGRALYVNDTFNNTIRRIDMASFEVTTIAGAAGERGNVDGPGPAARFATSQGITFSDGALYVGGFHGSVRRIDLSSVPVTVETIAGENGASGSSDGPFEAARFGVAFGILAHPDGNRLYYFDRGNNNLRELDLTRRTVETVFGPRGPTGFEDGPLGASRFDGPEAVATSADGSLVYVADRGNGVIRRFDVEAGMLSTISGRPGQSGNEDGIFDGTLYGSIADLTLGPDGETLWVADGGFRGNGTLRSVDLRTFTSTTLTSVPEPEQEVGSDGSLGTATFISPSGMAFSPDGTTLWVTDSGDDSLREVDLGARSVTTLDIEVVNAAGFREPISFGSPAGLTPDPDGNSLYVVDGSRHVVWGIDLSTRTATVVAGRLDERGSFDGSRFDAAFSFPGDVVWSPDGALWVTDAFGHAIRRVEPASGEVRTLVGQLGRSGGVGSRSAPLGRARLYIPEQLALTPEALFFTADEGLFAVPLEVLVDPAP